MSWRLAAPLPLTPSSALPSVLLPDAAAAVLRLSARDATAATSNAFLTHEGLAGAAALDALDAESKRTLQMCRLDEGFASSRGSFGASSVSRASPRASARSSLDLPTTYVSASTPAAAAGGSGGGSRLSLVASTRVRDALRLQPAAAPASSTMLLSAPDDAAAPTPGSAPSLPTVVSALAAASTNSLSLREGAPGGAQVPAQLRADALISMLLRDDEEAAAAGPAPESEFERFERRRAVATAAAVAAEAARQAAGGSVGAALLRRVLSDDPPRGPVQSQAAAAAATDGLAVITADPALPSLPLPSSLLPAPPRAALPAAEGQPPASLFDAAIRAAYPHDLHAPPTLPLSLLGPVSPLASSSSLSSSSSSSSSSSAAGAADGDKAFLSAVAAASEAGDAAADRTRAAERAIANARKQSALRGAPAFTESSASPPQPSQAPLPHAARLARPLQLLAGTVPTDLVAASAAPVVSPRRRPPPRPPGADAVGGYLEGTAAGSARSERAQVEAEAAAAVEAAAEAERAAERAAAAKAAAAAEEARRERLIAAQTRAAMLSLHRLNFRELSRRPHDGLD